MAPEPRSLQLYRKRARQLASRGRPVPQPALPPPLPPGRMVDLPGRGEIFVRDLPGPSGVTPVVLLHGWTASADLNWFGAFPAFEGRRRVIAVDHRGHGRGMRSTEPFRLVDCADDVAAVLEALGIERAIVAGYSMGGPITMLMAHRHPGRVSGVVVAATALTFNDRPGERWRWRGIWLLEVAVRLGLGDRLLSRLAAELTQTDATFRDHESWLTGEFSRAHPRALAQAGRDLSRFDARGWAGGISVPAASVITERDSLVPYERQRALAALLGATIVTLPEADHDVPVTDMLGFGEAMVRAVDAVDPGVEVAAAGA
ncbi:MAG TPA: alpha/beta hydrolase [Acidimicrobiales bacterium]|nr:alpha/beta hydrolase [Acidimicrobiales bacterium]